MTTTDLCRSLGIDHPIFNAPMGGGSAGPELAAAVSNAGGFGMLGLVAVPSTAVPSMVARTRELTSRPFGAGVILDNPEAGAQIEACLDARISLLLLFWGDAAPWVARAHAVGTRLVVQVGSTEEAARAAAAGVDAIVAQGVEAGGHVRGTTPLAELLPLVAERVRPLPVIAAGGIADGRGLAAALRHGAQAVLLGTRFLASDEASVDGRYKERIVAAEAEDTILTSLFDVGWPGAPHRVLRNRIVREWEAAGRPESGRRRGEGETIGRIAVAGQVIDVPRYSVTPPMPGFEGDIEEFCLYAGKSCGEIHAIRPAAEIVHDLVIVAAVAD